MEPKHTSRLENLVLAPDSASFLLDGRKILIKGDGLIVTREAFQSLYDTALPAPIPGPVFATGGSPLQTAMPAEPSVG